MTLFVSTPRANEVRVAHLVARLKNSSGIPPAVLGICKATNLAGGQTELYAGYTEPAFAAVNELSGCVKSDSRVGRHLGWTVKGVRHVRQRRSDRWAVHLHGLWSGAGFVERFTRPAKCAPALVLSPHGMFSPAALSRSQWRKRFVWWMGQKQQVASATLIHVTSEAERNDVRAAGIKSPIACVPLPTSSPCSRLRHPDNGRRLRIGFLGRITPIKRIELLVDAFAKVFRRQDEALLLLAGPIVDAKYGDLLRARTRDLTMVQWQGEVAGAEKAHFFENVDLLVLPSASENFGVVVTEALSHGVPVAAAKGTPWSALAEYGLGFHGFDNAAELAAVLTEARILGTKGLAALGERGPDYVASNYSFEVVGAKWIELYKWVLELAECPGWVEV